MNLFQFNILVLMTMVCHGLVSMNLQKRFQIKLIRGETRKLGVAKSKLLTQDSYHDNKLVTGVLSGKKGSQSFSVTGNDPKQPEKPKFGYTTTPEEPKPKDKLPLPKEPVDKPHKEKKPLKPIPADPTEPLVIPDDDKLTYQRPTESPKQLPKTGDSSLFSMLMGGALASVGVVNLKPNKKKNRK